MVTPFAQATFTGFTRNLNIFQVSAVPPFETLTTPENINAANYSTSGLKCTNAVGLGQCYWAASEINGTNLYGATFSVWNSGCVSADTFPETSEIRINTTTTHAGGVQFIADYVGGVVKAVINPLFASETVQYTFAELNDDPIANGTTFSSAVNGDLDEWQFGYTFDVDTGIFTCNSAGVDFKQFKLASTNTPQVIAHWGLAFGDEPGHGSQDVRSYMQVVDLTEVITSVNQFHTAIGGVVPPLGLTEPLGLLVVGDVPIFGVDGSGGGL